MTIDFDNLPNDWDPRLNFLPQPSAEYLYELMSGMTYRERVARGLVEGAMSVLKFGSNEDIDTGAREAVWSVGGDWDPITLFGAGGSSIEVFSADANDDAAGTGIQAVRIFGLDENMLLKDVKVGTNGGGVSAVSGKWCSIFRVYGLAYGSGERNAGVITVRIAGGGATVAEIPVVVSGFSQTVMACYSVAIDHDLYLNEYYAGINDDRNANEYVRFWLETFSGGGWRIRHDDGLLIRGTSRGGFTFDPELKIAGGSHVRITALPSANNMQCQAGFNAVLEKRA